jgi:aconitate hydratase
MHAHVERHRRQPEIAFMPARVLMQDFTGVPAVVDLAAMRDAMKRLGGDPQDQPAPAGRAGHRPLGAGRRVRHRRRASSAQRRARVPAQPRALRLPALGPDRLRNFASCRPAPASATRSTSNTSPASSSPRATAATLSRLPRHAGRHRLHTTMVNGLGVLGWGVGGIEAEAAMLGQPSRC